MPLPLKEPITFKGAKLTDGGPVAIALTLTQKQVEAMFGRKDELKNDESPLEIDFDNKKLMIGDMAASFTSAAEETIYREVCRRLPTGLDPLKPLTIWGNYIGKLNLQRNDQEIASNIKKKTVAENLKRDGHKTVFLDTPLPMPAASNSKRGKQPVNLVKKAISKSQANANAAKKDGARSSTRSVSTAVSQPPATSGPSSSSKSSNLTSSSYENLKELPKVDLVSPRSRAIHGLGAYKDQNDKDGMTPIEFRALLNRITKRTVDEGVCWQLLKEVGEPMPKDPSKWQLKVDTWREVRPDDAPFLSEEERQNLRRKGRIALNPPQGDLFWTLFQLKPERAESSKKEEEEEVYKVNKPAKSLAGTIPKGKVAARAKGTKPGTNMNDVPRRPASSIIAKSKGKANGESSSATASPPVSASTLSRREEIKVASSSNKSRALTVESAKKEPPPLSKPGLSREDINVSKRAATAIADDNCSDMEEGELPASVTKKRKVSHFTDSSHLDAFDKSSISGSLPVKDAKDRTKQLIQDEKVKKSRKGSVAPRTKSSTSSTSLSNTNIKREPRDSDVERIHEPVKRKHRDRRKTPEFSSSDEGEEDEPSAKRRATGSSRLALTTNRPSTSGSTEPKSLSSRGSTTAKMSGTSRSYPLPSDKEGIRREYQRRHPQYLTLKAKLFGQYAKVEELFNTLKETDSVSDTDLLEQEELERLVSEYKGLEKHLEQLTAMHAKLNTAY